ncbi:hypothetical protein CR51_35230 [Caballeronia megalochromosomata]|nr:hypothetical protein CR51_35230 [Caballeronia megalochromosomata]
MRGQTEGDAVEKRRVGWIDAAKGIGIFFVVLGHSPLSYESRAFVYAFHMPLFFFLSGFLVAKANSLSMADKARSLLFPYLLLCLIQLAIFNAYEKALNEDPTTTAQVIWGFLYSSAPALKIDKPYWFLPCLFVTFAYFKILTRLRPTWTLAMTAVFLSIIAYQYSLIARSMHLPRWPWSSDTALMAVCFMIAGYLCRPLSPVIERLRRRTSLYLAALLFFAVWVVVQFNSRSDMLGLGYGRHLYLYAAGSAAGIAASILLAQALSRVTIMKWLGENSLTLFMFQGNVLILINVVIGQLNNAQITDWHVADTLKWGLIYALVAIVALIPFCWLVNRYTPWLVRGLPKASQKSVAVR